MVPAVIAGMLAGTMLERFRGDRILVALGLIRAVAAALTAIAIVTAGATMDDHEVTMILLFMFAAIAGGGRGPGPADPGHPDARHCPEPRRVRRRQHGLDAPAKGSARSAGRSLPAS